MEKMFNILSTIETHISNTKNGISEGVHYWYVLGIMTSLSTDDIKHTLTDVLTSDT